MKALEGLSQHGDVIKDLLVSIRELPGFLNDLGSCFEKQLLGKDHLPVVLWFLLESKGLPVEPEDDENDEEQQVTGLMKKLEPVIPAAMRSIVEEISRFASTGKKYSLKEIRQMMPLHDNDFPDDFKKIAVFPTVDELNCKYDVNSLDGRERKESDSNIDEYCDGQFRMYRRDMIFSLREDLNKILLERNAGPNPNPSHSHRKQLRFSSPTIIKFDVNYNAVYAEIELDVPDELKKVFKKLKTNKKADKYFEEDGARLLMHNSVLFFISSNRLVQLGVIVRRPEPCIEGVYKEKPVITIHVRFEGSALMWLMHRKERVISEYVVQARATDTLEVATVSNPAPIPEHILAKLNEDESQLTAANQALSQEVSIIQGPPGTGKSFVGVQLVQSLLNQNPSRKIFCLCYTNHALDSFLESLLDDGLPASSIIRLGYPAKISKKIKPCWYQGKMHFLVFGSNSPERIHRKGELSKLIANLLNNPGLTHEDEVSWELISLIFKETENKSLQRCRDQFDTTLGSEYDMVRPKEYLWKEWCAGKEMPSTFKDQIELYYEEEDLWELPQEERLIRTRQWLEQFKRETLSELINEYNQISAKLISGQSWKVAKPRKISNIQIVACTTTFAAKNRPLIESFDPEVMLVEEAAEILECHIISSLVPSIEQLIMIGDHLQLRPKLDCYTLCKASGNGINFDVSLFERLVLANYPFSTLDIQHRMRPTISALIKHTYPTLQDSDRVRGREHIKGCCKDVVFINHEELEGGKSADGEAIIVNNSSKFNDHEASLALNMVKYFLKQGYSHEEIIILTPYLGQLMLLRQRLRKAKNFPVDCELSEQDKEAALKEEDDDDNDTADSAKSDKTDANKPKIRVATIDNFQGEEAKIIIASLVRSNPRGDIGFLDVAERVNVLMSRARDGFYLIGNSSTFKQCHTERGKEVWENIFRVLEGNNAVQNGFPTFCPDHKKLHLLKNEEDFKKVFDKMERGCSCCFPCTKYLPVGSPPER
eukprot:scaffold572_cov163-Ochromonas_danica.AAC.1